MGDLACDALMRAELSRANGFQVARADRLDAGSRACGAQGAHDDAASMTMLPHCGQCQPVSVHTMATRQIGQDRTAMGFCGLRSCILPNCTAPRQRAIQEYHLSVMFRMRPSGGKQARLEKVTKPRHRKPAAA